MSLRRSSEIGQADWIRDRLAGWGRVDSIVPGGFPAYIRVLHPAEGPEERPVRWAELAERAGVAMHASIGFADIAAALDPEGRDVDEPETGNLHPAPLAALCEVLARHTATPHTCWFGVWDGNHWLHPAVITTVFTEDTGETGRPVPPAFDPTLSWPDPSPPLPLVELPGREYRLLTGPLDAALDVGRYYGDVFDPHSPNLIWPDDHAWCVATGVDLHSTYIAASHAAAADLLADSRLEALAVRQDDPVS